MNLHRLPHLVELPARGIGADLIGRAGALLVDITIDTVPRGYRIAAGRSAVTRRAISLLAEDVDALEEAWEKAGLRGAERTVKVQAPGPVTLAAQLELAGGHRAITDPGAVRDLARSLAEGVAAHRAEVARRLECPVVVQFDEPSLPAALAGRLTGVTSLSPVHPIDESVAAALSDDCVAVVGGEVALHSCAGGLPWPMLQRSALQCGVVRPVDSDGGRPRRRRRVRRIGPHRAARRRARDRDPSTARRPRRWPGRWLTSPIDSASPVRCCPTGSGHAGMRARGRDACSGPATAIELAQKAADAIADDPAAILK